MSRTELLLQELRDAGRALGRARRHAAALALAIAISGGIALPIFSIRPAGDIPPVAAGQGQVRRLLVGHWPAGWGTTVETPAQNAGVLASRDLLRTFAALAVAMACATVAALVLSSAAARRREVALRAAVGAGPTKVLWETALEAGLLGVMAVCGLAAIALVTGAATSATRPELLRSWLLLRPGVAALAVGLVAPTLALLLFAPLAALPAASWRLAPTLAAAHSTAPPAEGSLRHALAIGQLAAALSLLIGAGLLLRASEARRSNDAARQEAASPALASRASLWEVAAPGDAPRRATFYGALLQRLANLPGVGAASVASPGTWVGQGAEGSLVFTCPRCANGGIGTPIAWTQAQHHLVGPGFFATLGVAPVRGRELSPQDAHVAVINRSFEAHFQGVVDPIGQFVRIGATGDWYRIVGVVADVRAPGIGASLGMQPAVYLPLLEYAPLTADVVVSSGARPAGGTQAAVQAAIAEAGALRAAPRGTLRAGLARLAAPLAWLGGAMLALAGAVLLLALHGVSAVAIDDVRRRRRELAVRSALGADPLRIVASVLARGLWTVLAGAAWATEGAILVAWLLQRTSPAMRVFDVRIYAGALAIVCAVALVASLIAVRAALGVEPREALAED